MQRRDTREIVMGKLVIGGQNPVYVEGMGRQNPYQVELAIQEINRAQAAGCEIFRLSIPEKSALEGAKKIKEWTKIPLIADVHFNLDLATECVRLGFEAVRINPGTLGDRSRLEELFSVLRDHNTVLRVGANAGSLPAHLRSLPRVEALFESIVEMVDFAEKKGVKNLFLSAKSTEVEETVEINRRLSKAFPYPIHIGVTEAGEGLEGVVKSALGIGLVLFEGIGNSIRVSLTSRDPVLEVKVAWMILNFLGLRRRGGEIISCPTCARCRGDVVDAVERVKAFFEEQGIVPPFRIAIMGCEVNGPGEAREAEVGLAFSRSGAVIFSKGRVEKVVPDREVLEYFIAFLAEKMKSVEAEKGGSSFEDVSSVCPNSKRNTSGS